MPLDARFRLGPFMVDEAGGLLPPSDRPACFSLRWRGCRVRAELRPVGDGPAHPVAVAMALEAVLGRVPSSAAASAAQR